MEGIKKWKREVRRGVLIMCVLALLSKREMYGYEISKSLETLGGGILKLKEGTLYPLLRRLEARGYVMAEWRYSNGKARRYYKITSNGLDFLRSAQIFWRELVLAVDRLLWGDGHV